MSGGNDPDRLLARDLGVRQLAAGIFNYTVGSGIFALPALAVAQIGAAAPLAHVVCAVVMGLVVLCLAEAGSRVSATGGPYAYVEAALGPLLGFVGGVLLFLADLAGAAAVSNLFAGSVAALAGGTAEPWLKAGLVILVIGSLAIFNIRGVKSGARVLEIATVAKLLPLLGFIVIGALFIDPVNLHWSAAPSPAGILGTSGVLLFAFIGIEGALMPSGEVRAPARTVPRAAFLALSVVTLLYIAIQVVAQGILGAGLAEDRVTPLALAAAHFAGPTGRTVMISGAVLSMFGYLSGTVLAMPRCLFAFGRDGFLPRWLASVHPRYRTPHAAIVAYTVLVIALALSGTFEGLAVLANVAALVLFILCAWSTWILRRRDLRTDGEPFRNPGGPVVPALTCVTILGVLWATVTRREIAAVGGAVLLAIVGYAVRAQRLRRRPVVSGSVPLAMLAILLFPAAGSFPVVASDRPPQADTLIVNGDILVFHGIERHEGTERPRFVQAAAITDGRIVFLGKTRKAMQYAGPKTRVFDLEGRMVMPGIVDGHLHGTRITDCEMGYDGGTVEEVLAKLQACIDGPDQVGLKKSNVQMSASHLFAEAILPPGRALTRYDLDRLDTSRPVLVRNADGHKFWMNSKAIENAHIDEKTPNPPGGEIGRDPNGKPNGFFADYDIPDWGDTVPLTEAARVERVRRTIADVNRMGITSSFIPGGGEEEISQWARVQEEGKLTLRVNLGLSAPFVHGDSDPADLKRHIAELDGTKRYARGLIEVTSVKVYCDGVMEYPAQTGAMLKPYNINVGSREKPIWRPGTSRGPVPSCSDAKDGVVALDKAGWQVHVHAIGDRATREALDNFQAALEQNGGRDLRHTITHLEAIDEADIPRFTRLGVIASMSLQWARSDAYSVNYTIGYIDQVLYDRLYPAAELWRAGAVIAGGSDYPVDPLLPFVQIETAIDHTGEAIPGVFAGALSPKEGIPDLLAVIKMHTINAAYQMHQEQNTGSLEVGKYADLIVLSQNLFRIPTEKISDTKVLLTMLGGSTVYTDPGGGLKSGSMPQQEGSR